jgi:hypothetical protein
VQLTAREAEAGERNPEKREGSRLLEGVMEWPMVVPVPVRAHQSSEVYP